ncbi:MAG: carbohydrate kinase family protein [Patescibacteria group bacterium]
MDSFDVIAVGNAKVDIFLQIHDTNKHFRLNPQTKELCIKSGDKAAVDSASILIGGNAANVSIGISRLGFKTAILAEIGSDEFADKIINTLNSEKVSEKFLKKTQSASSFSVIINYQRERTIFTEHLEREHDFSFENLSAKWIYLTSMGNKWHDAYRKTVEFVKNNNIKLAFNPGTNQLSDGADALREILSSSEIVFLNKEEACLICGIEVSNEGSLIPHLLSQVKNRGPKKVVITDGGKGASMIDESGKLYFKEPRTVEIIERTGAGDAFASGFLSALIMGKDYDTAMNWGSENAASVVGQVGATAGLLRKENIESTSNIHNQPVATI